MDKRQVPPALQKLLKADVYMTNALCTMMNKFLPFRSLKVHYKLLEVNLQEVRQTFGNPTPPSTSETVGLSRVYICAGYMWIPGWLALVWILWKPSLMEMQVNFFMGLLTDIILVGVLKAVFRRRRPASGEPDAFMTIGPDVYSFPSGHVSRACFIAAFLSNLWPIHPVLRLPLLAWTIAVSLTRILLRRHHLLDVLAGLVLGLLNTLLVSLLWLSDETAVTLISYISDERIEGGEYHV